MSEEAVRGLSRRSMVASVAWGVPVVALAVASPAAAASVPVNASIIATGLPLADRFGTTDGNINIQGDSLTVTQFAISNDGTEPIAAGAVLTMSLVSDSGLSYFGTPSISGSTIVASGPGTISIVTQSVVLPGSSLSYDFNCAVDVVPREGLLSYFTASLDLSGQTDSDPTSGFSRGPEFYYIPRTATNAAVVSVTGPIGRAALSTEDFPENTYATGSEYLFDVEYRNLHPVTTMYLAFLNFTFPAGFTSTTRTLDSVTTELSSSSLSSSVRLTDAQAVLPGGSVIVTYSGVFSGASDGSFVGPLAAVASINVPTQDDTDSSNDSLTGASFWGIAVS